MSQEYLSKSTQIQIVIDCPRCGTRKAAASVSDSIFVGKTRSGLSNFCEYNYEAFCVCGVCRRSCIAGLSRNADLPGAPRDPSELSSVPIDYYDIGWVSPLRAYDHEIPEHVPNVVSKPYLQGLKCLDIGCYDAAGAMFRKTLDLATLHLLSKLDPENESSFREMKLWRKVDTLHGMGQLRQDIHDLATELRHGGNDAAHDLDPVDEDHAEDLKVFAGAFLEDQFTVPAMVAARRAIREKRSKQPET